MEKRNALQGFGWPRQGGAWTACLIAVLMLAGCAVQPPLEPLPYRFGVARVLDGRDQAQLELPAVYPFSQTGFLKSLRGALPYGLFGSETATLSLTLTHYQSTVFHDSFALSMVVQMDGEDNYGRKLVGQPVMCSSVMSRGYELNEYAQQVWKDKNLNSLTPAAREQKMWQRVFDTCVQELGRKFGQALAQQQNAGMVK